MCEDSRVGKLTKGLKECMESRDERLSLNCERLVINWLIGIAKF